MVENLQSSVSWRQHQWWQLYWWRPNLWWKSKTRGLCNDLSRRNERTRWELHWIHEKLWHTLHRNRWPCQHVWSWSNLEPNRNLWLVDQLHHKRCGGSSKSNPTLHVLDRWTRTNFDKIRCWRRDVWIQRWRQNRLLARNQRNGTNRQRRLQQKIWYQPFQLL